MSVDPTSRRSERRANIGPTTRFVVLASERTGSNLLVELLNSSSGCLCAGELLNRFVEGGLRHMGERLGAEFPAWLELRRQDPAAFVDDFFSRAEGLNSRATGFKLTYGHAERQPTARDRLVDQPNLRIIHLGRRNLLRRLLSHQRAKETKTWVHRTGEAKPRFTPLSLPMAAVWKDFQNQEDLRAQYAHRFREHPALELWYEDLAADPVPMAGVALRFLGVEVADLGKATHEKTGLDPLREAIINYDELKASAPPRWASFFEE